MRWLRPASWNRNNLLSWQILENSRVTGAESCDGRFLWVKFWLRQIFVAFSISHFQCPFPPLVATTSSFKMMIHDDPNLLSCLRHDATPDSSTMVDWCVWVRSKVFFFCILPSPSGITPHPMEMVWPADCPWRTDDLPADEQLEFVASNQGWQWKFPQWEWTDNLWKMFLFKMGTHDLRLIWINLIILLVKMGLSKNMVSPIPLVHHPFKTSHY